MDEVLEEISAFTDNFQEIGIDGGVILRKSKLNPCFRFMTMIYVYEFLNIRKVNILK